jgi:hypothetical protein
MAVSYRGFGSQSREPMARESAQKMPGNGNAEAL